MVIDILELDDFQIKYSCFGTGNKTLVIIPGLSIKSVVDASNSIMMSYNSFLAEYTIYIFDRRINPPDGYTIAQMGEDTIKAIKNLKLNDFCLYGTSQGGMISQYIAINYPNMVNKLVLASTTSRVSKFEIDTIGNWIDLAKKYNSLELVQKMVSDIYSDEFYKKYGKVLISSYKNLTKEELDSFIINAKAIYDFDVFSKLSNILCPVLVIGAEGDKVINYKATIDISNKLRCKMKLYDSNYGHAVYDENLEVIQIILNFLNS